MAEESIHKEFEQRIKAVEKLDDLPPEAKLIIEDLKYETKNHRLTRKALTYQKDIMPLILEISTDLINLPIKQIDEGITRALKKIAQFSGAVRSSLFINSEDQRIITNTHEWCADQSDSQIGLLQGIPFKRFGYYKEQLLRSECVIINNLKDIPSEASGEMEWIKKHGFRSLLFVPLFLDKRLYGTLGFYGKIGEELVWPQAYIALLQLISEMFVRILERKKTEEALRESEEKYRRLIEFAQEGIWVIDKENLTTFVNPSMANMLGYTFEEMQGKHLFSFMDELGIEIAKSNLKRRQDGIKEQHDFEFIRKDGRRIVTTVATAPIQDEAGNYEGAIAGVIDITERKQAEDAVKESEAKYKSLIDNINMGVAAYEAKDDGKDFIFLDINKAGEKIDKIRKEDLIGRSVLKIFPGVKDFGLFDVFKRVLKTGKPENLPITYYKDERLFGWRDNYVFKLPSGEIVSAYSDETERKQVEGALRQSEKRFRDLSELLPEAAFETDTNMNLNFANKHAFTLFGYSQQDFEDGINALDLLVPEDRERAVDNVAKRFRGESFGAIEYRALRKDGSSFPIFLHATPIIDQGITQGLRGIIVDLSERKLIEEQLQQSQKMEALGTLSGGIAHEFNNILGIIIGNTELAIDDVPEWNSAKDCLEEIRTASIRAKDVVRKIMSFSRKTPAQRKPVQISSIVKESLKLIRAAIPANIEIHQKTLCEAEMILANPTEINQILMNLCSNSVHAMRDNTGVLEVGLETIALDSNSARQYKDLKPGNFVKLTVKDKGYGIRPDIINKVFDPYFTTKDVDEGLGMGLAIVYGIVKKHDGAIKINSAVDKGTTVEVLFPIVKDVAKHEAVETPEELPTGTETILFVDDEASLVKMVKQMMERLGYQVVGKVSSIEALKVFQADPEQFDLIITDMAMPHMAGDQLVQELFNLRPDVPIIICTGHSDRIDEEKVGALGVAAYHTKPYDKKTLANTVRKVLDDAKNAAND